MSDEYDDDPARRIYKRGDQKKVNRQAGAKVNGIADTESMLESNILVAGHVDPRVTWIVPQPATYDVNTGDEFPTKASLFEAHEGHAYKPRAYTPDFRFDLSDGRQVYIEGKHTRLLEKPPEFEEVIAFMKSLGHRLLVVTEEIFTPGLQRNLRILKTQEPKHICPALQAVISWSLVGPQPASCVMRRFGLDHDELFSGILSGLFAADLSEAALGPKTMLELGHGKTTHLEVLAL